MKTKFTKIVLLSITLIGLVFASACGEKASPADTNPSVSDPASASDVQNVPDSDLKSTSTLTPEPTATYTPTPVPTATCTPTPEPEVIVNKIGEAVNAKIYWLNANYYSLYDEETSQYTLMSSKGEKVDFEDFILAYYLLQDGAFAVRHGDDDFYTLYDRDLNKICDTSKYLGEKIYSYSDDMLCLEFQYVEDGNEYGPALRMLDGKKGFAEVPNNGQIRPDAFWASFGAKGFYNGYLVTNDGAPCVILYDREGNPIYPDMSQVVRPARAYGHIEENGWLLVECWDELAWDEDNWGSYTLGFWNINDGTYLNITDDYLGWCYGRQKKLIVNNYAVLTTNGDDDSLYALFSLEKNQFLTEEKYDSISVNDLINKYVLVSDSDGNRGYLNMEDYSEVFDYDDVASFAEGYAAVVLNGRAFVINEKFEEVADLCSDVKSISTLISPDRTDKIYFQISLTNGLYQLFEVTPNRQK